MKSDAPRPPRIAGEATPDPPGPRPAGDRPLYNHAIGPADPRSCLSEDGRTARIGASSYHSGRINVLMMDGSLRGVKPSMDLKLWRDLGTVGKD